MPNETTQQTDAKSNVPENPSSANLPATIGTTALTPAEKEKARANPFKAIALLLESVREALEQPEIGEKVPRWVRIARIRNYQGESDYISKGVIKVVDIGFIFAILYLAELTLKAKDLLNQIDSAKALVKVSGKMLMTVTDKEFSDAIVKVAGMELQENPLSGAQPAIQTVLEVMDKLPEPGDLDDIGHELYQLLCIEQLTDDLQGSSTDHINIANSGKVRLLQMALTAKDKTDSSHVKSITVRGLGKDKNGEQAISWLGGRRVAEGLLPISAIGQWSEKGASPSTSKEKIYEFKFEGDESGKDIEEANILLEKMGYPALEDKKAFSTDFAKQLRRFQKINNLQITGTLDNSTLNRLMHLNFETKSLERAKPYDAEALKDFKDDETPPSKKLAKPNVNSSQKDKVAAEAPDVNSSQQDNAPAAAPSSPQSNNTSG